MAIKKVNIGNLANDGTGDDLREAFIKVNDNFDEMQSLVNNAVTVEGANVGLGKTVFKEKFGNTLQFKTLVQGSNILLTEHGDSITITGDIGIEQLIILTEAGSIIVPAGQQLLNVYGGQNIGTAVEVDGSDSYLKINVKGQDLLSLDPNPHLGADLIGNNNNIHDVNQINAVSYTGNLQGTVYGIDVRNINTALIIFDFGGFIQTVANIIDYVYAVVDVDFGSFITPAAIELDEGLI